MSNFTSDFFENRSWLRIVQHNATTGLLEVAGTAQLVTNTVFSTVAEMLAETPAANTCAFLSQAAFVGDGAPIAPVPVLYTGTRWVPFGNRQILFKAQFGTIAAPTRTVSTAPGKVTMTNDPTIPASLMSIGDSLIATARVRRHGVAAITDTIWFGSHATHSSNSVVASRAVAGVDLAEQELKTELTFLTATSLLATRSLNPNATAAAAFVSEETSNINIASAMKFFFGATQLTDSLDVTSIQIEWIVGTYI